MEIHYVTNYTIDAQLVIYINKSLVRCKQFSLFTYIGVHWNIFNKPFC